MAKGNSFKKNTYYVGYRWYTKKEGHKRVRKVNKSLTKNYEE